MRRFAPARGIRRSRPSLRYVRRTFCTAGSLTPNSSLTIRTLVDAHEAPRASLHAGHDERGLESTVPVAQLRRQPVVQLLDVAGQAPSADVDGTDVQGTQPGGEQFLLPGRRFQDPEG